MPLFVPDTVCFTVKPSVSLTKGPVTTNFVLRCNITGYPHPLVAWNFNGDAVSYSLDISFYPLSISGSDKYPKIIIVIIVVTLKDHSFLDWLYTFTVV